jgi:hypothetical protein
MVTAGVLSVLYIYAMANFATCIAYTVIAILEIFFVIIILLGLATMASGDKMVDQAANAAASALDIPKVNTRCKDSG